MKSRLHIFTLATGFAALVQSTACLPADTRPTPATIQVDVVPMTDSQPLLTADGWTIAFDRLVAGLGDVSLGDACTSYSEAHYDRLLDGRRAGEQKLGILYGIGSCELQYRMAPPNLDTLLGDGITETDRLFMGTKQVDGVATKPTGVALDVAATATRGSSSVRLHWLFRQGVRYRDCKTSADAGPSLPIDFTTDQKLSYHLALQPSTLFANDVGASGMKASGVSRFDPIAAADATFGNGDGEVTLEELGRETIQTARLQGPYGIGDADAASIHTLEDYVYRVLFPRVPRFLEPVECTAKLGALRED